MKSTQEVNAHVFESERFKVFRSPDYNYTFNKANGQFARWGRSLDDDPQVAPAPEILDLEISVDGCPNACNFCYKNNKARPATNMTLETFKSIVDKFPKSLTQIAFGITGVQTNPDFIPMMEYCRKVGVIPNFTLSGIDLTDDIAAKVAGLVGALAVSAYQSDKNVCYETVKTFTDLGLNQTNIHLLVSDQTMDFVYEVLEDRLNDPRLADMNAIVFLGVKPKGRAAHGFSPVDTAKYARLIKYCLSNDIPFGFDSCSAPKFEAAINLMLIDPAQKRAMLESSESCESSIFSSYINVAGEYWHCSFSEDKDGIEPVNILEVDDFIQDVWNAPALVAFRSKLLAGQINGTRHCPVFPEINK